MLASSAFARVAELADALDLGSSPARGGGSNPPSRISPKDASQKGADLLQVRGVLSAAGRSFAFAAALGQELIDSFLDS